MTPLGNDRMTALSFLPIRDPAVSPGKQLRGWTRAHHQQSEGNESLGCPGPERNVKQRGRPRATAWDIVS